MSHTDDIVAIQQLLARANTAIDCGDGPGYAACFTADGVLDMGADGVLEGTDAIAGAGGSFAEAMPGLRHWVNNHVIQVDGDQATATVYILVLLAGEATTIGGTGAYRDAMVRTADGWRFSRRTPQMAAAPGPLQIPAEGA